MRKPKVTVSTWSLGTEKDTQAMIFKLLRSITVHGNFSIDFSGLGFHFAMMSNCWCLNNQLHGVTGTR